MSIWKQIKERSRGRGRNLGDTVEGARGAKVKVRLEEYFWDGGEWWNQFGWVPSKKSIGRVVKVGPFKLRRSLTTEHEIMLEGLPL